MAPTDKFRVPFRWEFSPFESPRDKAIHWIWRAYDHAGHLLMESDTSFESRLECLEDASRHGYRSP
jgi:hypothetical protein